MLCVLLQVLGSLEKEIGHAFTEMADSLACTLRDNRRAPIPYTQDLVSTPCVCKKRVTLWKEL